MQAQPILESADVRMDESRNRPRKIRGEFRLPSSDTGDVVERIKGFLRENAGDLKLSAQLELELIQDISTPARRIVRLQQKVNGVPVHGGIIVVQLDSQEQVKQVDIEQPAEQPSATPNANDASALTPEKAAEAIMTALGHPQLRLEPEPPAQVYYPARDASVLAYRMLVAAANPPHDWQVVVNAHTGEILEQRDLIKHVNGTGLVFDPNPTVTAMNNTLRDPDATGACGFAGTPRATIDAQRVSRTLNDITFSGGTYKLEGPYAKMRNFGAPNVAPPTEASANAFNYSSGDDRFEAVNVYYHVDKIQRYVQSLGITNANNRQTECDAHDNSVNAAWYSPIDKGLHFSDSGACRPDRGEDGECMIHEYGHAIQDNQVPGWGGTNPGTGRDETGAMGEGFGDALACTYFAPDFPFQREIFEDWIFGDTALHGLRRVDGTKVYPGSWTSEVHNDGEIWSAALWNIYRTIGGDSMSVADRRIARDTLMKSVILSHFSVAANGTMPDGAEAVMETHAELPEYRGKYLMQMLDSFHARGLLTCSPAADLYIRDDVSDPGLDNFTGPVFWNSPDLWIRNANDNGTAHQNPEFGQDNYFYCRVRNRGTVNARAFVVTFNVKPFAGIQFTYPGDFVPFVSAAVGFNLAPGASTIVKAKWPASMVPPVGTHACWLASVYTPVSVTPAGKHVWESNNLAQKNLTIVNLVAGDSYVVKFQLGSLANVAAERFRIEVRRPQNWSAMPVSLVGNNTEAVKQLFNSIQEVVVPNVTATTTPAVSRFVRFVEPAKIEVGSRGVALPPVALNLGKDSFLDLDVTTANANVATSLGSPEADLVLNGTEGPAISFQPGANVALPIALPARTVSELGLKVSAPADAKPGDELQVQLYQRDEQGRVIGGITVQVNVKK